MRKLFIALFLCMLAVFTTVSAASEPQAVIESVTITPEKTHMTVTASLPSDFVQTHADHVIYLFALSAGELTSSLDEQAPIASQKISESISFRFYISGKYADRVFDKYQLAIEANGTYTAIGEARYLDAPELLASVTEDYPTAATKKGLQTQLYADAQILGAAHTVVTLPINELISTTQTPYSFTYLEQIYYLDSTQLELLDYKVRRLSLSGIQVYLNLVLTAPKESQSTAEESLISSLYYSTQADNVQFFAFHVENDDASHLLEGLLQYLTARYTRSDRQYGFAASFIVGYEVNSNRFRNYCGSCSLGDYAESYAKLIRLVHNATRSVYANARIYLSLANNWTVPCIDPTVTPNTLLDYSAYDFLTAFQTAMSAQGEPIEWSVAINPYASDLSASDFWNDAKAEASLQTPYMTMKNIEVLSDLLSSAPYAINGKRRTILISEFGVSGQIDTDQEAVQAAAFAYAYYKACAIDSIDAIIWHRHVDRIGENQLYFGLWSGDYSAILAPKEKKQLYHVFRFIDTERINYPTQADLTAFALPIIGAQSWEELIPGFANSRCQTNRIFESVPASLSHSEKNMPQTTVYDFSFNTLYSFYPSDSARYLELQENSTYGKVLYASLFPTSKADYAGIATYSAAPITITDQSYIQFLLSATCGGGTDPISVLIRMTGTDRSGMPCIFEGACDLEPVTWTTVSFSIADFAEEVKEIDSIRIWIRGVDNPTDKDDFSLSLARISMLRQNRFSLIRFGIHVLIGCTILVAVCFVIYLIVIRFRKKPKNNRHSLRIKGSHRYRLQSKNGRDSQNKRQ